jgi:hypothetical protein
VDSWRNDDTELKSKRDWLDGAESKGWTGYLGEESLGPLTSEAMPGRIVVDGLDDGEY